MPEAVDLYDLLQQLSGGIEDLFPDKVWVRAEIASVQLRSNGHCYLELTGNDGRSMVAKARAVIWRNVFPTLSACFTEATGSPLSEGMQVLVRAQVSYSALYGLSLVIDEIEPEFTVGAAEIERQRTIKKLEDESLMDAQKALSPVTLPYSLAVVSAGDAAGFGDFCRHIEGNPYGFVMKVTLFPATMQGESCPSSVGSALEAIAAEKGEYDAVLLMRGGGSNTDLACFDDYELCRAIASCPLPVFTAIGHERDYHVADMVAFSFAKTPTALADCFIDMYASEDERLSSFSSRLALLFSSRLSAMSSKLDVLESRIVNADPRRLLGRGYALVCGKEGNILRGVSGVSEGDELRIVMRDGNITALVKEVKTLNDN